jgi:hypothetical protein
VLAGSLVCGLNLRFRFFVTWTRADILFVGTGTRIGSPWNRSFTNENIIFFETQVQILNVGNLILENKKSTSKLNFIDK